MTTTDSQSSGAVIPKGSLRSIGRRGAMETRSAMALVLTLAMIVLVTVFIVAFYTYATANRQIENSRASQVKAEQLARSAADYVTEQFIQEITNVNYSTNLPGTSNATTNMTIYRPLNSTNIVPIRGVTNTISGNTNFYNLIRQSIFAADTNASSDSTATPSENGRLVSTNRWNAPVLNTGSGFTAANQLPNWIYLNKTTGITTPPITTANSPGVIGRFAYNVYDISGLLDANVAGFPSTVATNSMTASSVMKTTPAGQGTVAGTDLTVLGVSQSAVDMLRTNFCAPNGDPNYTNQVWAASQNGFLSNTSTYTNPVTGIASTYTNSLFINRQDLLRYAQAQNTGLTNALPYLTAFSRTLNAPSWGPTTNAGSGYNYQSIEDATTSTNRFIPNVRYYNTTDPTGPSQTLPQIYTHYNDDGTYTTNFVNAGDPLIQRRFSLAKLAWLTATGPSTTAFNSSLTTAQKAAAILYCFGLQWDGSYIMDNNTDGDDTPDPAWLYIGNDGYTTIQSSISTLDSAAQDGREPTFFELLKAGILSGSLGQSGYTSQNQPYGVSYGGIYPDNVNSDSQIIRIGANIIDQYKSDGYPTAIVFGHATTGHPAHPPAYTFWGTEDLPYFYMAGTYARSPSSNPTPTPPVYNYIIYELWNPHVPSSATIGPSNFQVRIGTAVPGSASYHLYYWTPTGNADMGVITFSQALQPPVKFSVGFQSDRTNSDVTRSYREPHVIRDDVSSSGMASYDSTINCNPTYLATNTTSGVYYNSAAGATGGWVPFDNQLSNTVYILDYLAANGNYYPYATFVGHEEGGGVTGINANIGTSLQADTNQPPYPTTSIRSSGYEKDDPRSYRFDGHWQGGFDTNLWPSSYTLANSHGFIYDFSPLFGADNGNGTIQERPAYLAINNSTNYYSSLPQSNYYADPDGVVRPGDEYWGSVNPFQTGAATTPAYNYRPVILNHPFTSVADMGYAFRDEPFKSLDFFSSTSADAGLLDLFCLHDEPAFVAGQVNLNTAQPLIQQSIVNNAVINSYDSTNIASATATALASSYQSYAFGSSGTPTPTTTIPLTVAQLSQFLNSYNTSTSAADTKSNLEAPVRALSSVVQTRTWNILIDVVAQVGTYPRGTTPAPGSFIVQGEKRYWLSIAIDRYTGQIVDQQLESVNE